MVVDADADGLMLVLMMVLKLMLMLVMLVMVLVMLILYIRSLDCPNTSEFSNVLFPVNGSHYHMHRFDHTILVIIAIVSSFH